MDIRSAIKSLSLLVLFIGLVSTTEKAYAQLQINELSASNKSIVADEEGEFEGGFEKEI